MVDLIAKLISGDAITNVLILVGVYLGLIWLLFSFWVFIDAKKRYKKIGIAIIYFFVVLIFSFPALIFYLITRPEDDGEFVLLPAEHLGNRGVNIPVVNFIGKDGKVNLSFELRINSDVVGEDMSINVDWNSQNKNFKREDVEVKAESTKVKKEEPKKASVEAKTRNIKEVTAKSFSGLRNKVNTIRPKFNLPKKQVKKEKNK